MTSVRDRSAISNGLNHLFLFLILGIMKIVYHIFITAFSNLVVDPIDSLYLDHDTNFSARS